MPYFDKLYEPKRVLDFGLLIEADGFARNWGLNWSGEVCYDTRGIIAHPVGCYARKPNLPCQQWQRANIRLPDNMKMVELSS